MNNKVCTLLVAGCSLAAGYAHAGMGYVSDSSETVTRTGFGECVHTVRWSEQVAVVECEPAVVAAREAAKLAAVEVVIVKELKPVQLEADTLFGFDSADLTDDGKQLLNALLGSLTATDLKDEKIRITGHTDMIGDDVYNIELSKRRAAAVRNYLVTRGVVPSFIETSGVGEADPVVSCEGKRGAALIQCLAPNRRAEVELSAMELIEVEEIVSPEQ
ncbi:OOP family OmpA-OmpF porin [Thiogranum longum]|uniref:OOP family OmpA-OmpF porin n=1 Tax=Thiogranum longum TaxID=1537524 RepID=A0A4R1HEY9_9GAMM|nr:OmpA family protein [Thiogranum longum]TCK18895.1 OOP family OmpA-OmpF porin [Thiogranum longum]